MRVLITGIAGFVGAALARRLSARGHTISGTYINERPRLDDVELHEADLLDPAALAAAIYAARPETVVHLAGLTHVGESWGRLSDYYKVNFLGTENLLRAAGDLRVLMVSTAEVYGSVPEAEQPIAEERAPAPSSPYAVTKAAAERLAVMHDATIARLFNLIGPRQSTRFALPGFALQLAEIVDGTAPPVLAVGNLAARRDFLHVEDGVDGLALLVEKGEPGGLYNVGSGTARSIEEVLELLIEVSGAAVEHRVDPERLRRVDIELLCADPRRLAALGWSPRRTVRSAVEELWLAARRSRPARSG